MLIATVCGLLYMCVLSTGSLAGNYLDPEDFYYPAILPWSDNFDWSLLKRLSADHRNLLVSPISLKILLAIVYEGASGNTKTELKNILELPANDTLIRGVFHNITEALQPIETKNLTLDFASKIFLDNSLTPQDKFQAIVKTWYNTTIRKIDFTDSTNASRIINHWVTVNTHKRIKKLVSPDNIQNAAMILTNAVYFKGSWHHPFPVSKSSPGRFYISPTELIQVNYMTTSEQFYYGEAPELDAKILRLPYTGNRFGFFIVLPNKRDGLPEMIKKINRESLGRNLVNLMSVNVVVTIPKFKFDFQARYAQILEELGIKQLFQQTASLPGIVRGAGSSLKSLQVTDIIQKSGIEINEEGSTLYAATEVELSNKFGASDTFFNATHPFLFYVEESTTGSILFMGKVVNPLEGIASPLVNRFGNPETQQGRR